MLTLYGFGKGMGLVDASPFVLKVDCYLRMSGIEYQPSFSLANLKKSPKGKLPFIEDGNKTVADSSFIIEYLKKAYGDSLDVSLSAEQMAIAYLVGKSIDENLYWCLLYMRWFDEQNWPRMKAAVFSSLKFPFSCFVPGLVRHKVKSAISTQGIGKHSASEVKHIFVQSLDSLSDLLDQKTYFFGDTPSSLDATAYAFLAQFILSDLTSDLGETAKTYPNLVAYCQRIQHTYY